jgi:4-hydroxy-2-oxoheptanedioate aldolase
MEPIRNTFKQALAARQAQIGLWVGLADPYVAELLATTGFDWLLIDGEHAPNNVRQVLGQLQAVAPYPVHPIVRPVEGDVALIKQYLDIGAQTLLIPMVETAEQAARCVAATRYPPQGIRGVGSALARASRWSQIGSYLHEADGDMCVLVQVESVTGLNNLAEIAAVDGVDGVFFGPADLSASMGYLGRPGEPVVQQAIADGIATVLRAGKAPGILTADTQLARSYLDMGALFVAVGVDTSLLAKAATSLARSFKACPAAATPEAAAKGPY